MKKGRKSTQEMINTNNQAYFDKQYAAYSRRYDAKKNSGVMMNEKLDKYTFKRKFKDYAADPKNVKNGIIKTMLHDSQRYKTNVTLKKIAKAGAAKGIWKDENGNTVNPNEVVKQLSKGGKYAEKFKNLLDSARSWLETAKDDARAYQHSFYLVLYADSSDQDYMAWQASMSMI